MEWEHISRKETLSEEFMREHANQIDWESISRFQPLTDSFVKEMEHTINFYTLSYNTHLTFEHIQEHADKLDCDYLLVRYYPAAEELFTLLSPHINWRSIHVIADSLNKPLIPFLEKYAKNVCWEQIFEDKNFYEEDIHQLEKIAEWDAHVWGSIAAFQPLSEDFIETYQDKLDWDIVFRHQQKHISFSFVKKHIDKINIFDAWIHYFSREQIEELNALKNKKNKNSILKENGEKPKQIIASIVAEETRPTFFSSILSKFKKPKTKGED